MIFSVCGSDTVVKLCKHLGRAVEDGHKDVPRNVEMGQYLVFSALLKQVASIEYFATHHFIVQTDYDINNC